MGIDGCILRQNEILQLLLMSVETILGSPLEVIHVHVKSPKARGGGDSPQAFAINIPGSDIYYQKTAKSNNLFFFSNPSTVT